MNKLESLKDSIYLNQLSVRGGNTSQEANSSTNTWVPVNGITKIKILKKLAPGDPNGGTWQGDLDY